MEEIIDPVPGGIRLRVYVRPRSAREGLTLEYGELVFHTTEPPIGGRANRRLIKSLARLFGVSSANITIVSGYKSRVKVVEVSGVDATGAAQKLREALAS